MFDQIVVPTDGSEVADAAVSAAITLADRFDAHLHAIHVLEMGELPPGVEDDDADQFASVGSEATTAAAERAAEAGVEATTSVIVGGVPIHRGILDYADDHDVDCIVMGTYGRTGLDRFVLGSVAERTLREASVPVLTVHEETTLGFPFERILVPTDGSDGALVAADRAIDLALATDAALHVVHVVDPYLLDTQVDPSDLLKALEDVGEQAVETIETRATDAGVSTVETELLTGNPHRSIVDYADEHEIDCIVMGTHGRTGLERYILGSVTERIVRLADVPVLSVKQSPAE
ncbi:universal stress protein [Halomicroarcula limicola]|uniref:Universal stress protein n=2 Tax=Haloarcula limicola TaxID=1429915 RepID=A0A8J7YBH7_9EURY|nr:universal stress protein [Halomicroarcula limicola]MBV0925591.1 universal stress protein [Halomicroarcula limicola]